MAFFFKILPTSEASGRENQRCITLAVCEARPPKMSQRVARLGSRDAAGRGSHRVLRAMHSYAAACSKPAAASRPAVGYDTERAYGRRKLVQ
jgi:hypothetical protein